MIQYFSETDFNLEHSEKNSEWLTHCTQQLKKTIGEINYIFCDDEYLLKMNQQYLNHDTYTDIISFDDSTEEELNGDIFISIERVKENAQEFNIDFELELARVMVHGILHFIGFKDKTEEENKTMREQENLCLKLFHDYVPRGT